MKHKIADFLMVVTALFLGTFVWDLSRRDVLAQTNCDINCLDDRVADLSHRVATLEEAATTKKTKVATKKTTEVAVPRETFVQIAGGKVAGLGWTKIEGSDLWFDQSLYGNVSGVTWEGWVENGNGEVRLYDETNNRGVDGSEVKISASGRASFYSAPLSIWRGQNKYYIQIRSETGGEVEVTSPRLRVLTK